MKKSELRKIVSEEIQNLIEQEIGDISKLKSYLNYKIKPGMSGNKWITGTTKDGIFAFNLLVFEDPSSYGINQGRISKLWMRTESTMEVVVDYDRGWKVKPKDPKLQKLVNNIIKSVK